MAMSLGRPRKGAIADINVTPMADVMIVLLIIFMVATPLIAKAPVHLPDARHPVDKKGERVEVLVRRDGAVLVAGSVVPAGVVGDWIAAMPPTRRATVLVQADRDVAYADVARVLAACRMAGVAEVTLATQRKVGP
jgi:biopolymer transport protein TolR